MDEHTLNNRINQLIDSLDIGNRPVDIALRRITDYLQKYSDQRKKPSEIHGLDNWANDALGFEPKQYSNAERTILRKYFQHAEKEIIEKAKFLLELMIDERQTGAIKEFLRQLFKDELKAHICQIIADRNLSDYKVSLINLYLKGTQKSSQAAFDCMRSLKDITFYYPLKQLQPSRHKMRNDDLKIALNDFKEEHLEIRLAEDTFQGGDFEKIDNTPNISKFCEVLIGLDYPEQKLIFQKFKTRFKDQFVQIGKQLKHNYTAIGQIKAKDYTSSLKKAVGDSLMIGGWDVSADTESLMARNLASQKDIDYIDRIFDSLNVKYRHKFFKSVLNPPKHIKGEFSKKRLLWVYDQLRSKFKTDFEHFETFIKWHTGNEDIDIQIETMLLSASLSREPGEEFVRRLKEFSQDDHYQKYHDRINAILPTDSLWLERKELESLSYTALESKLFNILNKKSVPIQKTATENLCEYLKDIHDDRFEFVFEQILQLILNKLDKADNSTDDWFFKTLVSILVADLNTDESYRKDFILGNHFFLDFFCDHYPDRTEGLSEGFIARIVKNCFSIHASAKESMNLALQLSFKGKQHRKCVWAEWINQIVSNKDNLSQIIEPLYQDEKTHVYENVLMHISTLKNEVKKSKTLLIEVNESMQRRIGNEILPQLARAKQRAGDQPLLTENYDRILGILSDYVQKEPGGKMDRPESNLGDEPLFGIDATTSLSDLINKVSSMPMNQRDLIISVFIESKYRNNQFGKLLNEASGIPRPRQEWFTYRLIDFVLSELSGTGNLLQWFQDEKLLWNTTNKMLFRLHSEHQEALKQIRLSRNNKLKEIGQLIGEYLEKIEINLFGYYELSESLSKMGLERIFNKPGEIVTKEKVDMRRHKVLPSQKDTGQYQVITLGLKLPSDETVREAFLESKEQ